MGSNVLGWAVGGGAVVSTALYQIWAGTKQKELQAGSMQARAPISLGQCVQMHRRVGRVCQEELQAGSVAGACVQPLQF